VPRRHALLDIDDAIEVLSFSASLTGTFSSSIPKGTRVAQHMLVCLEPRITSSHSSGIGTRTSSRARAARASSSAARNNLDDEIADRERHHAVSLRRWCGYPSEGSERGDHSRHCCLVAPDWAGISVQPAGANLPARSRARRRRVIVEGSYTESKLALYIL
jgi:hypothetical protein